MFLFVFTWRGSQVHPEFPVDAVSADPQGGLGYGPRFRRCYAYGVQGQDEDEMHAVAYLRHLSSQEEWQKNMEIQPPMLDSMQHSLNAVTMT